MADRAGFEVALNEEREHLQKVQAWYEEATLGLVISGKADGTGQSDACPQLH